MVRIPCHANGEWQGPAVREAGLGFELTEEAFKKYPFAGSRPMAKVFHEDGSFAES
jgi:hypothetical protein